MESRIPLNRHLKNSRCPSPRTRPPRLPNSALPSALSPHEESSVNHGPVFAHPGFKFRNHPKKRHCPRRCPSAAELGARARASALLKPEQRQFFGTSRRYVQSNCGCRRAGVASSHFAGRSPADIDRRNEPSTRGQNSEITAGCHVKLPRHGTRGRSRPTPGITLSAW